MTQTVYLNQFNQTPIKGNSATKVNLNTLAVAIDPNSTNTLLPGDAVYLTTTTANQIYVDKWSSGQGIPFGYILYNMRTDQFVKNDRVEIGLPGTIMFAEAGAQISRGQSLEYQPNVVATGPLMIPAAGINPISAVALDNASASGSIFRMMVLWQPEAAQKSVFALTYVAAGISVNPYNGETQTYTATASATFNATEVIPNSRLYFVLTNALTTAYAAITFGTNFKSSGTISMAEVSGKIFTVSFVGDGVNYNEISRVSTGM